MIEVASVFDKQGQVIHWHLPPGRSGGTIPDSKDLWSVLWESRHNLGGVAHTHPWDGPVWYSVTDVTTFAAVEDGLGVRLIWVVATFSDVGYYQWEGPNRFDYVKLSEPPFRVEQLDKLLQFSQVKE